MISWAGIGVLFLYRSAVAQPSGIQRVWAVDDGERIKKTATSHPLATSGNNRVWDGAGISLFGARNEFVAFQLIIQGNGNGTNNVNVLLDSLFNTVTPSSVIKNSAGALNPYNYLGRNIEMFVEHYVNVTERSNSNFIWWSSARPLPDDDYIGLVPEQLVPFESPAGPRTNGQGGAPFSVAANQNQAVWVDIYVPRDALAGNYTGTIKVTENSVLRYSIPITLKVFDFTLPDTTHVKNGFYPERSSIAGRHGLSVGSAQYWTMVRTYQSFLHRHRAFLNHVATPSEFSNHLSNVYNGSFFSASNNYAGPGVGVAPNYYMIGPFDQPNRSTRPDKGYLSGFTYNPDTLAFRQVWRDTSNWWASWFLNNAPSTTIYKYGPEEPGLENANTDTSAFADMRRKSGWLKTNPGPGSYLKYRTATNIRPDLRGTVDVWFSGATQSGYTDASHPWNPYPRGYIHDSAVVARQRGERVGLYGGTRPAYGTEAIDAPAIDQRANCWIMWKYGIDEYWYWAINLFGDGQSNEYNPWFKDKRWNSYGDGTLVYAGQNLGNELGDDRGLPGPIAGIRLKNWRRGTQDYEYLHLARRMGIDVTSVVDSVVTFAFEDTPQNQQARFAQRGYQYESARRRLAELIAANSVPFPTGSMSATPNSFPAGGGTTTLTWSSSFATTASIDNGIGVVPVNGNISIPVVASTTFRLSLGNSAGNQVISVPVTVAGVLPPPQGTLIASPDTLPVGGGQTTLIWVSSNAVSASFDNGIGSVPLSGTLPVQVDSSRTFRLTLTGSSGSITLEKRITVRTPPPLPSGSFTATPDSLPAGGGNVTLVWNSANTTAASINHGVGDVPIAGTVTVFVPSARTFSLTLTNQTGSQIISVPIRVAGNPLPPSGTFSATPDSLPVGGGNVTLTWTSANATSAVLDHGIGPVLLNGSLTLNVTTSTIYRLTLSNPVGTFELAVPITVAGTTQPPSGTFVVTPDSLPVGGGNVTLVWVSYNASNALIDNGIGSVPLNGSHSLFISNSTSFALTLSNTAGSQTLSASVRVGTAPPAPTGTLSATPDTFPPGGGTVTLGWTSQNATSATFDNGIGSVSLNGSLAVIVSASTVFRLTLSSPSGSYELAVPVLVSNATEPPTGTFVVTPDTLPAEGGDVTLVWVSNNAATASLNHGIGAVPVNGSLSVYVATSQTFVLTLDNSAGSQVISATVRVAGTAPQPSGTFSASPDTLPPGGGNVILSWASQFATSAFIDNGIGAVPLNGSISVPVTASTIFRLTLSNATGSHEFVVPVFVHHATQPPTGTFVATPDSLPLGGGNVILVWLSSNAQTASIDNGIGAVPVNGVETVFVADTRTYALTLSNEAGSRIFTTSIRVADNIPSPTGSFSASPDTFPPGGGNVRLTWTSSNATSAGIDNGIGPVALNGSLMVPISQSTVFRLTLTNGTTSYEMSVPVVVRSPSQLPSGSFVVSPDTLPSAGGNVTLVWASTNALSAAIDNGIGTVTTSGSMTVNVTSSKTFRLSLSNDAGTTSLSSSVIVTGTDAPPTGTLIATPDTLPAGGGPVTLIWVSSNGTSTSLDNGIGNVALNGSLTVNVVSTKTFRLTVSNASGSYVTSVRIRVANPANVPGGTFVAIPDSLPPGGGTVRLMWVSTNSTGASIDHGIGPVNLTGYRLVYVPSSDVFRLTLSNNVSSLILPVSVRVGQLPPPLPTGTLTANPSTLPPGGGEVTLSWTSSGADSAFIDQNIGNVPLTGSRNVTVGVTRTFVLRLKNQGGDTTVSRTVTVDLPNAGPEDITILGTPDVLIATPGGNGNQNIEVIRDGITPPVGSSNPLEQYDTYTGETRDFDWMGYQFPAPQTFNSVLFQEGMHFPSGGWFDTLGVQVLVGEHWVNARNLVASPAYQGNTSANFETHDLTFTPIVGTGLRIAGKPGGAATFVSVAELRVMRLNEPAGVPRISFIAVPDTVPVEGGDVTLYWAVANAQSARIAGNAGSIAMTDSMMIHVDGTTRFELIAENVNGERTEAVQVTAGQPLEYALSRNYPNPFNPSTRIQFSVKGTNEDVTLVIYDILGQRVRTLFEGRMEEGSRVVEWDGLDEIGRQQSTGTYIYQLRAGSFVDSHKMLLLK